METKTKQYENICPNTTQIFLGTLQYYNIFDILIVKSVFTT